MEDTITVRCSALPLAMLCPASIRDGGLRVDPVNDASASGTAAHVALRAVAETGAPDWDAIAGVVDAHPGADLEDVRMIVALGVKLWAEVKAEFPRALTEVPLSAEVAPGLVLTGHVDVYAENGRTASVGDWKTGRVDMSYREQVLGYAALGLLDDSALESVRGAILWVRDGDAEFYTLTREMLGVWMRRVADTILGWDGTYRPGAHCDHCPRAHDCPAARALVKRDVAVFAGMDDVAVDISRLTPDQHMTLRAQAKRVAALAERVLEASKAHLLERGPVTAGGATMTAVAEERREVLPLKAWPVIDAELTSAELADAMRLSIGAIEKAVATKAGRGNGAKAVRALNEKLEAVGAIARRVQHTVRTRRS